MSAPETEAVVEGGSGDNLREMLPAAALRSASNACDLVAITREGREMQGAVVAVQDGGLLVAVPFSSVRGDGCDFTGAGHAFKACDTSVSDRNIATADKLVGYLIDVPE